LPLIVGLLVVVLGISVGVLRLAAFWIPPVSALTVVALLYPVWMWRKLALASRYLSRELERAASSGGMLEPDNRDDPPADVLDRQMHLLSRAVQRERDLGKFLNDRLSQMPDCVLVTNLEGSVVFANERARKLFGALNGAGDLQSADDLLNYLYCLKPTGRVPVRFSAVPRMHGIPWNCEAETVSGSCFDVRFQPQQNSAHELVGYVIRIVDNTDMVTTQRQRNDALELLSHDMRAPQSSIISYVDSLGLDQIHPEAARRIQAYAGHTLKLADDFVHLARAQTVEVVMTELDLVELVTEAAQSLWPQAKARQVSFAYDFADEGLWVRGDASLLARTFGNLIDNAIKFAREDSVVTLSCKLIADGPVQWAAVAVTNEGEGIAPSRMATLYRRFQSTAPAGTYGVGLGLAFIHTVVVRHRGRIRCESVEGERTTFTVELPAEVSSGGTAGTLPGR
jgi:signal transduction histidine kinase